MPRLQKEASSHAQTYLHVLRVDEIMEDYLNKLREEVGLPWRSAAYVEYTGAFHMLTNIYGYQAAIKMDKAVDAAITPADKLRLKEYAERQFAAEMKGL